MTLQHTFYSIEKVNIQQLDVQNVRRLWFSF